MSSLHPALVHFPIALLVTGALWLVVASMRGRRERGLGVAIGMLSVGALMTIPAVGAGLWAAAEHESHHGGTLASHRLLGLATMAVALLGLGSHFLRKRIANADIIRDLCLVGAAVLAVSAAALGGEMSHGEGHEHNEDSSGVYTHDDGHSHEDQHHHEH